MMRDNVRYLASLLLLTTCSHSQEIDSRLKPYVNKAIADCDGRLSVNNIKHIVFGFLHPSYGGICSQGDYNDIVVNVLSFGTLTEKQKVRLLWHEIRHCQYNNTDQYSDDTDLMFGYYFNIDLLIDIYQEKNLKAYCE